MQHVSVSTDSESKLFPYIRGANFWDSYSVVSLFLAVQLELTLESSHLSIFHVCFTNNDYEMDRC